MSVLMTFKIYFSNLDHWQGD